MLGLSRDELLNVLADYTKRVAHQPADRMSGLDPELADLVESNKLMIGFVLEAIEANNRKITEQLAAKGIRLDD